MSATVSSDALCLIFVPHLVHKRHSSPVYLSPVRVRLAGSIPKDSKHSLHFSTCANSGSVKRTPLSAISRSLFGLRCSCIDNSPSMIPREKPENSLPPNYGALASRLFMPVVRAAVGPHERIPNAGSLNEVALSMQFKIEHCGIFRPAGKRAGVTCMVRINQS